MKSFMKLYWPMIITFVFLLIYGLLFGGIIYGDAMFENDVLGIILLILTILSVVAIYGEMIYFIIKAANNKALKHKVWWCVGLYYLHIFIIPYFNLKYVCYEKKIKGKMLICVAVSIFMFMVGFLIPNYFGGSNESLSIKYENKVEFNFPVGYRKKSVGEYDIYAKDIKRDINFGAFVYDEDDSETARDVLTQRDYWIKSSRGPVTVMDEYYKEFDDSIVRGNIYIGFSEGVRNIYYVFTIEFKNTDTFVNVIAVNLYEDYLDYKDEFFKIFEDMEYIGM